MTSNGFFFTDKNSKNGTDSWLTPLDFILKLGKFDLDPCGLKFHKTAENIYDLSNNENGLTLPWSGRVWLNPPYSDVKTWLDKLAEHGNGIALVFARTDTKWCQQHMKKADSVFFLEKRIKFLKNGDFHKNNAGHGSMFLSYGENINWPFDGFKAK